MPPSFPEWPGSSDRNKAAFDTLSAEPNGRALMLNNQSSSASSGHYFETINASGHANLHLGDVHFHANPPSTSAKEQLMATLHFPEMFARFENIQDPYSDTFKWILEPSSEKRQQWSSFVDWLHQKGGLYWISGKPGSGKSVLTKHLAQCAQDREQEAQSSVVLSFWFWEAAHTPLERNLLGCLRSLLWQLLDHPLHGDATCKAISSNLTFEWTLKRLQDSLNSVLKLLARLHIPVLIFLDGLDECRDSGRDVLTFATSIVRQHDRLKLCVSSRPEPLYQVALLPYPHLRMQDLNGPDIYAIIDQDLLQTPEFELLAAKQHQGQDLRDEIANMAQGVLLWVRLVSREFLQGIVDGDTVLELKNRLMKMPSELDGDNGLYAFMLKRNATNSTSYLADAAFYFQLASHRDTSVIELCLASSESLRANYVQLADGWERLHFELDCDRMARAVSARTAGLLEVVHWPTKLCFRAAKTRCGVLTNILNAYESSRIDFIHRTARIYIFETSAGHQIMAASTKSLDDIKHICFETWLISWIVFKALESVAPVGLPVLSGVWRSCENCNGSTPALEICLSQMKYIVGQLEQKSLLYAVPHQGLYWTLPSMFLPIPKLSEQRISFGSLFASHGIWEFAKSEFDIGVLDPLNMFYLFRSAVMRLQTESIGPNARGAMRRGLKLCDELLYNCPDPNFEVTNTDGEQIPVFYLIVFPYDSPSVKLGEDNSISLWLQQASADTLSRRCTPTMAQCSKQFFAFHNYITILGAFSYVDMAPLTRNVVERDGSDQLSVRSDTIDTDIILWSRPEGAWKPVMYQLSPSDSTVPLQNFIQWHREDRQEYSWWGCHVGMIRNNYDNFSDGLSHTDFLNIISASATQVRELKSLVEVFKALGKTAEAIDTFAAAEDDRIRLAYDELIYQNWRSWMYGIDDPFLQRYQHIPRPSNLYYSLEHESFDE